MKQLFKFLSVFVAMIGFTFLLGGCGGAKLSPEVQKAVESHEKMYTQLNMHMNPGRGGKQTVETTNYSIGILIPINSEVTLSEVSSNTVVFVYNGIEVTLISKAKYTGLDMQQTIDRYFGKTQISLGKFTNAELDAIKNSETKIGMSKEAVLLSRGYPPSHVTPSLDGDTWTFWKTRWNKEIVQFKDGKVEKIID